MPPRSTLSRNPRGHSSPPRDVGLALRRSSPEDTAPRRHPPPPPTSPRGKQRDQHTSAVPVFPFFVQALCTNQSVRRHRYGTVLDLEPHAHSGEGGVGGGALPGPVSSGEILRSDTPKSRGGLEWPRRLRFSVVPGGHPLRPRPEVIPRVHFGGGSGASWRPRVASGTAAQVGPGKDPLRRSSDPVSIWTAGCGLRGRMVYSQSFRYMREG